MKLRDLNGYEKIYIQTHDNPDADALASGFGVYLYLKEQGKDVTLFYSGRNEISKSNLKIMVSELEIPIMHRLPPVNEESKRLDGILVNVDCQHGCSNVTTFDADEIYIIDHHQVSISDTSKAVIKPDMGGCATLVWRLLLDEGFEVEAYPRLCTALYYGLSMDTNLFAELSHPYDRDLRDSVPYNKAIIRKMNNANISIKELELAGVAMIRAIHNDDFRYALIHTAPCDPNLLGIISDFLLQVDEVDTCVVYYRDDAANEIKYSVRSCIKEVRANELASYVAEDIGGGGGHIDKAGGRIAVDKYEEKYPTDQTEHYFSNVMNRYFSTDHIVYAKSHQLDTTSMQRYVKLAKPLGYLPVSKLVKMGHYLTVRSLRGDIELDVNKGGYIVINNKGEAYWRTEEEFDARYEHQADSYDFASSTYQNSYPPSVVSSLDGKSHDITVMAASCIRRKQRQVFAAPLSERLKVFPLWDEENYILGEAGDYLVVSADNEQKIYIEGKKYFDEMYTQI